MSSQQDKVNKRIVHFSSDNVNVIVDENTTLLEAAHAAGLEIRAGCGGKGTCGSCKMKIEKGSVKTVRTSRLSDEEFLNGIRQACQSRILTDLSVSIPGESRLEKVTKPHEVSGKLSAEWKFNPPLKKYYIELPVPTMEDNISDLSRLLGGLRKTHKLSNVSVDFDVIKQLPGVLRQCAFKVTVTVLNNTSKTPDKRKIFITRIEPGDTTGKHYSIALDIGTTTIWGQLLDLNHGRVVSEAMLLNSQISYGADVISRIAYTEKNDGLNKLQQTVVGTINQVIEKLTEYAGISPGAIGHFIVAGNTTMTQLFMGLESRHLRLSPYVPVANYLPPVKAVSLGLKAPDYAYIFVFPSISSYVGGDIVSGLIGAGVHQRDELTLYIDIGTNGEMVIGNSEWMVTTSCSAGPAFEGGGVKYGMIASPGAIEEFKMNGPTCEPSFSTIGGEKPRGICGTGLISIIAELFESGAITPKGRFNTDYPDTRIRQGSEGNEYVVCRAEDSGAGKDIVITESDIDNLIRAKAAVYAGCQTLIKSVGINMSEIQRIILAGSFGSSLDIVNAITIGLLPDVNPEIITFFGNGSLIGARLTSCSTDLLDDAYRVAGMMTGIELSDNVEFSDNYMAALFLPHTDIKEFPTVAMRINKKLSGRRIKE